MVETNGFVRGITAAVLVVRAFPNGHNCFDVCFRCHHRCRRFAAEWTMNSAVYSTAAPPHAPNSAHPPPRAPNANAGGDVTTARRPRPKSGDIFESSVIPLTLADKLEQMSGVRSGRCELHICAFRGGLCSREPFAFPMF